MNTRVKMERIASNIAGNIATCGCPFRSIGTSEDIQDPSKPKDMKAISNSSQNRFRV